ncbi:MAG: 16S rRNA processing protein RimM [Desulfuromonas sp.]|uniref:ribosome maturation factor RimM n=1 Tax=Desulfuromonas sp. TaxID=892 RepID=UPI000CC543F1|nr:ribosome maturation factor RimM [Desulfuromonas sp.]PLX81636.1 MAG: 16S rRNA processing protein RimM [Desulfuromonas sp.]
MRPEDGERFAVGVVSGTHGLRGDLKVRPLTDGSGSLLQARQVFFDLPGEGLICHAPVRAVFHKKMILLRLKGMEDINAVQPLVGFEVLMDFQDLEELPEGEHYWRELRGVKVHDRTFGDLGILEDLLTTAAHDIYVVRGRFGEVLIPAVEKFVIEVDQEGRRMLVDLPEGLVTESDEV